MQVHHVVVVLWIAVVILWPGVEARTWRIHRLKDNGFGPQSSRPGHQFRDNSGAFLNRAAHRYINIHNETERRPVEVPPPFGGGKLINLKSVEGQNLTLACGGDTVLSEEDLRLRLTWFVRVHRKYNPRPRTFRITRVRLRYMSEWKKYFYLDPTFSLTLLSTYGYIIDTSCYTRDGSGKTYSIYRITIEKLPPLPPRPTVEIATTTTPPPPTFDPTELDVDLDNVLPPATQSVDDILGALSESTSANGARMIAKASPIDGDIFIIGQPWSITVTMRNVTDHTIELLKSGKQEYAYHTDGREEGRRVATASGSYTNPSVMVIFDSMQTDDIAEWTCTSGDEENRLTTILDLKLSSVTVLEPESKIAGVFSTNYHENSAVMQKPWRGLFTLGGAAFTKVEASLAGSVVYSSTSGGEEGRPRADAASAVYNSSTGVVTVTFDKFEGGDAALWSFDFGLDNPVELDLSDTKPYVGEVQVTTHSNFAMNEQWSVTCTVPGFPGWGEIHFIRYREFIYGITNPGAELGKDRWRTAYRVRSKSNSTSAFITFNELLSDDLTVWTMIVFKEDDTLYGVDSFDFSTVPLMEVCEHQALLTGPHRVGDSALTASSVQSNIHMPDKRSRMDCKLGWCGWCPRANEMGSFLQVDLGRAVKVVKVATTPPTIKDGSFFNWFVTRYKLEYSFDGRTFKNVNENDKYFEGNTYGIKGIANNTLPVPVTARYIRLTPLAFNGHMCMMWELYGCTSQGSDPVAPDYTTEGPLRFTMEPPTIPPLGRSPACGGGGHLPLPPPTKHDSACRSLCKVKYNSCIGTCNGWHDPLDRRECESRCAGEACSCGRLCTYKRQNHQSRPPGIPQVAQAGSGRRRPGQIGGQDLGLGGIGGMGGLGGQDIAIQW